MISGSEPNKPNNKQLHSHEVRTRETDWTLIIFYRFLDGTQVLGGQRDCKCYRCNPCKGREEGISCRVGELLQVS